MDSSTLLKLTLFSYVDEGTDTQGFDEDDAEHENEDEDIEEEDVESEDDSKQRKTQKKKPAMKDLQKRTQGEKTPNSSSRFLFRGLLLIFSWVSFVLKCLSAAGSFQYKIQDIQKKCFTGGPKRLSRSRCLRKLVFFDWIIVSLHRCFVIAKITLFVVNLVLLFFFILNPRIFRSPWVESVNWKVLAYRYRFSTNNHPYCSPSIYCTNYTFDARSCCIQLLFG